MRGGGARVGVGELLAAHRALEAVDAASREEAYFALRAALCSSHADLGVFAEAFAAVFAAPEERRDPFEELGEVARMALPRVGVPDETREPAELDVVPVPAAWSEEELLHDKDFADVHRRRARGRAAAAGAAGAARAPAA